MLNKIFKFYQLIIKFDMGLSEPLKMGLYEHCSIKQISYVNIYNIIL